METQLLSFRFLARFFAASIPVAVMWTSFWFFVIGVGGTWLLAAILARLLEPLIHSTERYRHLGNSR